MMAGLQMMPWFFWRWWHLAIIRGRLQHDWQSASTQFDSIPLNDNDNDDSDDNDNRDNNNDRSNEDSEESNENRIYSIVVYADISPSK